MITGREGLGPRRERDETRAGDRIAAAVGRGRVIAERTAVQGSGKV